MARIVYLLEDDDSICDLIECTLDINGIECHSFNTVKEFNEAIGKGLPDVALLDIMLADGNGLDVLKQIKQKYRDLYCIIISALGKETDKVKGLNLGADDYIPKPFGTLELAARVNAVFRRIDNKKENAYYNGNVKIDITKQIVFVDDREIEINNKEYSILKYLMENENRVLTRENIMLEVWGYDFGETRTLDNYIAHLRKLGVANIETVFGVGYRLRG